MIVIHKYPGEYIEVNGTKIHIMRIENGAAVLGFVTEPGVDFQLTVGGSGGGGGSTCVNAACGSHENSGDYKLHKE